MTAVATCPTCAEPRAAEGAFCEGCGYDFTAEAARTPPQPATWFVEVRADRQYFDRLQPDDVEFPSDPPTRTIELDQPEILVGRHSTSSGVDPDVDLACEPVDIAVSHRHVLLVRADDGSYGVVDLDSTNGTCLNEAETPIEPGVRHLLADGDRIHLGAWTTITLRAGRPERITEEVVRG
jgi:hypothetical protein